MKDINGFIRKELIDFIGYSASTSIDKMEQDGIVAKNIVKLDANENPYGCSPSIKEALGRYDKYHIYPDATQRKLRKLLAGYCGVLPQQIVAANGSDQLIDIITKLFITKGDEVINPIPTFQMYEMSTKLCGGRVVDVKRNEGFGIDIAAVKKAITQKTKLIFIANPNAPTGNLTPQQDIAKILDIGLPTVLDEAYYEFSQQTALPLMRNYPNLIIIRTFSKWAGLAGLRVGYGVFPVALATIIMKVKQPYSVSVAAQVAVRETLKDITTLRRKLELIKTERSRLYSKLEEISWLKPYPSVANFILCYIEGDRAINVARALRENGVLVRHFEREELRNYLRISVGKKEETDILIKMLHDIGG